MPDRGARLGEPCTAVLTDHSDLDIFIGFAGAPSNREELPLPVVPPFTAFIGNLTFETEEPELREFFTDLAPTSVRLVKDPTGKPKGFGYVEFPSQDKLKEALARNMTMMAGRTIRVSVAEARECDGMSPSARA